MRCMVTVKVLLKCSHTEVCAWRWVPQLLFCEGKDLFYGTPSILQDKGPFKVHSERVNLSCVSLPVEVWGTSYLVPSHGGRHLAVLDCVTWKVHIGGDPVQALVSGWGLIL